MPPVISQLVIDSANPYALAAWWRDVLDWTYVWDPAAGDDEIELAPPDGSATNLLFVKVDDTRSVKNRLHLDLRPPNGSTQQSELDRLQALGAVPLDIGQGDVPWRVLADPEGNEFCLLGRTPAEQAAREAEEASD
ncbi:VOC family protein [Cellulomonas sp. URHD0024]|uniref:VOC family protein n=1 Tax=Cellulomonas sp. URHD0024 TaxID=1302620 RepID=UPI00055975B3|nr:VOC family protein [Cellulomonas sp. URHD0024]